MEKTSKNNIKWNGTNLDEGLSLDSGSGFSSPLKMARSSPRSTSSCSPYPKSLFTDVRGGNQPSKTQLEMEIQTLDQMEKELDHYITQSQFSYDMETEDEENKRFAYVTYRDIRGIKEFSEQTVIAIKAPAETKLEVPDPQEVSIRSSFLFSLFRS